MDSYTIALRQAADKHGMQPTVTPTWFRDANAASNHQDPTEKAVIEQSVSRTQQTPLRPPPKSSLRSRSSFTQLERVVEETASQRSSTRSPRISNSAGSIVSTTDSVQTAIFNPRVDGSEPATSSSSSSGRVSNSTESQTTPDSIEPFHLSGKDLSFSPATSLTGSDRRSLHNARPGKAAKPQTTGSLNRKDDSAPHDSDAASDENKPMSETAPAPAVPREPTIDDLRGQEKVTSHLRSAAHALASKLKPGHSDRDVAGPHRHEAGETQHSQPMTEAIDGMIAELEPPSKEMRMPSRDSGFNPPSYNARTPQSSSPYQSSKKSNRPGPNTYETMRDGVPILMKQKSGVWVETVEGAELTSAQDQQRNVPKDQPLAEREAEDVPEIQIPEDPWNNLPPYIRLEYGTAQSSRPMSHRPNTRARREQATASWAKDQASMQQRDLPHTRPRPGSASGTRSPSVVTPWDSQQTQRTRPRRRTMDSETSLAPFYYEKGKIRQNSSHPSNIHQTAHSSGSSKSKSSSEKPSGSDSSPNTSLTTNTTTPPPPRNPRRAAPDPHAEMNIQERIAQSASAVEQLVYGLPMPRNHDRPSRLEGLGPVS